LHLGGAIAASRRSRRRRASFHLSNAGAPTQRLKPCKPLLDFGQFDSLCDVPQQPLQRRGFSRHELSVRHSSSDRGNCINDLGGSFDLRESEVHGSLAARRVAPTDALSLIEQPALKSARGGFRKAKVGGDEAARP
jgi:hypothetical protein